MAWVSRQGAFGFIRNLEKSFHSALRVFESLFEGRTPNRYTLERSRVMLNKADGSVQRIKGMVRSH